MPNSNHFLQRYLQNWKQQIQSQYSKLKSLQGDPHYIAMGMAVGVFVAFTPTIPFHTVFAIGLAFVLKGSKPAALMGSWFSNPLTIPALYYGSFKIGDFLLGTALAENIQSNEIKVLLSLGWDVTVAMVAGGILLGIIPAISTYFLTFRLVSKLQSHRLSEKKTAIVAAGQSVQSHQSRSKK
jgi:uncharacterized protein (DUF2062 family)